MRIFDQRNKLSFGCIFTICTFLSNVQNETHTKEDNSVATLFPAVVGEQAETQTVAKFSPQAEDFDSATFTNWLDKKGGKDYLQLDPYTRDGLKGVLRFNRIDHNDIVWTEDLHTLYNEVLILVQNKGRFGNWTASAEEGLHRLTASVVRTLACELDIVKGCIRPDTIEAKNFSDYCVGQKTDITGSDFRKKIYASTFENTTPGKSRLITAKKTYFQVGGLNGCEALYHLRARSYATSVNKRRSVKICPFALIGEFMGKLILNMNFEQATYRIHFHELNPTNLLKKDKKKYDDEVNNSWDFETAFPMSELFKTDAYKNYLQDPFAEGVLEKALDLF